MEGTKSAQTKVPVCCQRKPKLRRWIWRAGEKLDANRTVAGSIRLAACCYRHSAALKGCWNHCGYGRKSSQGPGTAFHPQLRRRRGVTFSYPPGTLQPHQAPLRTRKMPAPRSPCQGPDVCAGSGREHVAGPDELRRPSPPSKQGQ